MWAPRRCQTAWQPGKSFRYPAVVTRNEEMKWGWWMGQETPPVQRSLCSREAPAQHPLIKGCIRTRWCSNHYLNKTMQRKNEGNKNCLRIEEASVSGDRILSVLCGASLGCKWLWLVEALLKMWLEQRTQPLAHPGPFGLTSCHYLQFFNPWEPNGSLLLKVVVMIIFGITRAQNLRQTSNLGGVGSLFTSCE